MGLEVGMSAVFQSKEILQALQEATGVAFREATNMLALEAQQQISPHSITYQTMKGIKPGRLGKKVFVQTEWPGIAIDRPHRVTPRGSKVKKRRARGQGREVEGLYYIEDAFKARRDDIVRTLQDKTDTYARRQAARVPQFEKIKPAS